MKLKPGASVKGMQWYMFYAAIIVEPLFLAAGQDFVITSGTDGRHPDKKNIHGNGFAIDCRTRDIPSLDRITALADECRRTLPPAYDVVVEKDHIHIEYDPKPGEAL